MYTRKGSCPSCRKLVDDVTRPVLRPAAARSSSNYSFIKVFGCCPGILDQSASNNSCVLATVNDLQLKQFFTNNTWRMVSKWQVTCPYGEGYAIKPVTYLLWFESSTAFAFAHRQNWFIV